MKTAGAIKLIAPYAVWMVLMMLLPESALGYAIRTAATAAVLVGGWLWKRQGSDLRWAHPGRDITVFAMAAAVGVLVFAVWILPEKLFPPEVMRQVKSAFDPSVCGWPMTLIRLAGSALVISVAEELFFRKWLMDFAGFWWSLGLFAVEHGERWAVGIAAGLAYAMLARRFGIRAAIVAHATTNLVLGIYVLRTGNWFYW